MASSPRPSLDTTSSGRSSPDLSASGSTTRLIIVNDDDSGPASPLPEIEFDSDEELEEDELVDIRRPSTPPLPPFTVFIYLLAPFLKLGAILLPNTELELKYGLPAFVFFALLSAFARHVWYMLALYVRKPDIEDVVCNALARGHRREQVRRVLRSIIRGGTGVLRVLLAAFYLRETVHSITPLVDPTLVGSTEHVLVIVFSVVLFPISLAQSLASKRVVYATALSIVTFLGWLFFTSASYAHGTLQTSKAWLRVGVFWQGMTVTTFAFTSSNTLSLYASSRGAMQAILHPKKSHSHSFGFLSILSVSIAAIFILPLVFFAAYPRNPQPLSNQTNLQPYISCLHAATLLLFIPFMVITTPTLPFPERTPPNTRVPLSKGILSILIALLASVPSKAAVALSDILIVCALGSTYLLPALIHIILHHFKRPLSLVIPPAAPRDIEAEASTPLVEPQMSPSHSDELLQRKEKSMQRMQIRKRLLWDIGVWILLVPVGGGGLVWMIGEIAGRW